MMRIYLPSLNRAHRIRRYGTLKHFPEYLWGRVSIVVNDTDQRRMYKKTVPSEIEIVVSRATSIATTRMFTGKFAHSRGEKVLAMFDDDLRFYERLPNDWHMIDMKEETYGIMIDEMESHLNEYSVAGISGREGNNREDTTYRKNTRIMRAWAIRSEDLMQVEINDTVMDDLDLMLQLLEQGKPNICIYKWAQAQQWHHHEDGGTATYRTEQSHADAAYLLQERHPQFVQIIQKHNKSGGMPHRTDVRIRWEKAYEYGKANRLI
jgi:hypothetical protein